MLLPLLEGLGIEDSPNIYIIGYCGMDSCANCGEKNGTRNKLNYSNWKMTVFWQ